MPACTWSAHRRHLLLAAANPGFVPHLLALCRTHEIEVVVPTVDAELLAIARARREFESAGVRLLLASDETLAICMAELNLLRVCEDAVPVGHYAALDESFNAKDWKFPLIVKPRRGAGSRGVALIDSAEGLASVRAMVSSSPGVSARHGVLVDVLASGDGQIVAAVPRARLKVDSGIAVTGITLHDLQLEGFARRVAERIGLHYTANSRFPEGCRRHARVLLEVEARFPGTMPLTVHSGINMPLLPARRARAPATAWADAIPRRGRGALLDGNVHRPRGTRGVAARGRRGLMSAPPLKGITPPGSGSRSGSS